MSFSATIHVIRQSSRSAEGNRSGFPDVVQCGHLWPSSSINGVYN